MRSARTLSTWPSRVMTAWTRRWSAGVYSSVSGSAAVTRQTRARERWISRRAESTSAADCFSSRRREDLAVARGPHEAEVGESAPGEEDRAPSVATGSSSASESTRMGIPVRTVRVSSSGPVPVIRSMVTAEIRSAAAGMSAGAMGRTMLSVARRPESASMGIRRLGASSWLCANAGTVTATARVNVASGRRRLVTGRIYHGGRGGNDRGPLGRRLLTTKCPPRAEAWRGARSVLDDACIYAGVT